MYSIVAFHMGEAPDTTPLRHRRVICTTYCPQIGICHQQSAVSTQNISSCKVERDGSARNHAYEVGGLEEVEGRRWEQGRRFRDFRGASGDGSRLAAVRVGVGRVVRHERVHQLPFPRWTPS
jgi:hypothetical protein